MPLSPLQKKTLQVNFEVGFLFFILLTLFSAESAIYDNIYFIVFLTLVALVFAGGIVPYVYERESREVYSVLGVLGAFYIHATILVLFDFFVLGIPLVIFFSWGYLISSLLSAPVATGVWLGLYTTMKGMRLKEMQPDPTATESTEPESSEETSSEPTEDP